MLEVNGSTTFNKILELVELAVSGCQPQLGAKFLVLPLSACVHHLRQGNKQNDEGKKNNRNTTNISLFSVSYNTCLKT
jgi:hypothetical protein